MMLFQDSDDYNQQSDRDEGKIGWEKREKAESLRKNQVPNKSHDLKQYEGFDKPFSSAAKQKIIYLCYSDKKIIQNMQ